jgi:hypothetical protein
VCEAGISPQKERLRAAVAAGEIEFRDISLEPEALKAYGASVNDARRRLRAVDRDGDLLVGADVVVAVWRATPLFSTSDLGFVGCSQSASRIFMLLERGAMAADLRPGRALDHWSVRFDFLESVIQ